VLEAALRLVARDGYQAVTIEGITDALPRLLGPGSASGASRSSENHFAP
jgi:AcrR family transcriptional regulator